MKTFLVLLLAIGVGRSTEESLSGPCKEWIQNDCRNGRWVCTSVEEFERSHRFGPQPGCPTLDLEPPTPPPGQCRLVDGVCQYAEPAVTCDTWVPDCDYRYTCGTVEERERTTNTDAACGNFGQVPPSPDMLCIPVNDTCQWYNPCRYWRGFCLSGYHCGTADQYYAFLFGPQPLCALPPEGWVEPQPPGECVVQDQECRWSNCVAYLDWCRSHWTCGTQYDQAVYLASPPPPCPAPPPGYMPPPQPGECRFNVTASGCQFQPATVIQEDVCVLGIVQCPADHTCVPWPSSPVRATCIRSCASNNGGCGDEQVCVERPFCGLCELRTVMNGHCEDRGDDDQETTTTTGAAVSGGGIATTAQDSSTSSTSQKAITLVGGIIGMVAGVSIVMIAVLCIVAIYAHYNAHKGNRSRVAKTYKNDNAMEEPNGSTKYSELKFQDNTSESSSSLEKEDLSTSTTTTTTNEEATGNDYVVV